MGVAWALRPDRTSCPSSPRSDHQDLKGWGRRQRPTLPFRADNSDNLYNVEIIDLFQGLSELSELTTLTTPLSEAENSIKSVL